MRRYFIIALILSTAFWSCESFLDKIPDDRTDITDVEAVKSLLVSAYPEAHYILMAEWMSDNADDKRYWGLSTYPIMQEESYYWEEGTAEDYDSPYNYWTKAYGAVAAANHALEAIDNLGNAAEYQPYRGEALVARAYAHFMLVNFWGKHFNPSTASTDLGVPYVKDPEKEDLKIYTRNTVGEVYDFIERDFMEGIPLLQDNAYDVAKYHFTKDAANAFATRYYLYRGDSWDKVIEYASKVLGEGTNYKDLLRNYQGKYLPISSNSSEYQKLYTNYGEPAILLLTNGVSIWYRAFLLSRYGLSNKKVNEVFPNVEPVTYGTMPYTMYGSYPHVHLNKVAEYMKLAYPGATVGYPYIFCAAFTMEEVVFNRAEAYAMKKEYDKALADINTFFSMRIKDYNATAHVVTMEKLRSYYKSAIDEIELTPWYVDQMDADQMMLVKYITKLRRAEFYSEGMRWFDVKRFHIEVKHQNAETEEVFTLTKDDPRRELQIPIPARSYGMEANPR